MLTVWRHGDAAALWYRRIRHTVFVVVSAMRISGGSAAIVSHGLPSARTGPGLTATTAHDGSCDLAGPTTALVFVSHRFL